jgi:predicted dienelactone hydrolase
MRQVVVPIVTVAVLGSLWLAAATVEKGSPARAPEGFDYPQPTGRFQVGTAYLHLEDPDRLDAFSDAPGDHRWISVKVWYPASPPSGAEPASFGDDEFSRSMVEAGFFDSSFLAEVASKPSASFPNVPFASQGAPWPILIYSSSGVMTANVFLSEELASHGYVVLAVGHPYWCEFYFDGEGKLFFLDKSNKHYTALWAEENSAPVKETKERITRSADADEKLALFRKLNELMPTEVADLALWQGDIDFLIDQLVELNKKEGPYRGQLDTDRIGIMGYSKGGALAGQFCASSGRVRAGINLGGFMFGGVVENDLDKPFMTLSHVEPWCRECPPINLPFFVRSKSDAYLLDIDGGNHATFTDVPLLRAYIVPEGIVSPLDEKTSASIIKSYVLAFFDTYVRGLPRAYILDEVPSRFDAVRFMKRTQQAGSGPARNTGS